MKQMKSATILILVALTFSACSHEIEYITPAQQRQIKYEAAFLQTFRTNIDPKNDWGFGNTRVADDGGEARSRSTVARAKKDPDQTVYYSGRVFCEDLGSSADFDFNDVVFDVDIFGSGRIEIEVLARGGTLPVSVADVPITMGQMTNTGVNTDPPQRIDIPAATAKVNGWLDVVDIPVVVRQIQAGEVDTYELTAKVGQVPQKICTHKGVLWPLEYTRIDHAYPQFKEYVAAWQTDWTTEVYPENLYRDF
ncbi:MAG: hypothetical protein IJ067_11205 [Prevotella sp.]|nr:hypothetical protein [Prevotella sp.]